MDQLSCIKTFIEVAQTKSFSAAARRRGMSRANVTKHVAALEEAFGARLLTRNSQFVSLTEAGLAMLEGGIRLVEDLEGLTEEIQGKTGGLTGLVRVGVPPAFGAHSLVRAVVDFRAKVDGVDVALFVDDGSSNLVREGLDVSIRISETLQSTDEVAKLLIDAPQIAVASPEYLANNPPLKTPEDLRNHQCLVHLLKSPNEIWSFVGPEGDISVKVSGGIRANFGEPLMTAALLGQGIAIHPVYMLRDHVEAGRLKVVLPDYQPSRLRIHAVYPQRRYLPMRIRLFLDFIKEWLTERSSSFEQIADLAPFEKDAAAPIKANLK